MKLKYKLLVTGTIFITLFSVFKYYKHQSQKLRDMSMPVLTGNEREKLIINNATHTITKTTFVNNINSLKTGTLPSQVTQVISNTARTTIITEDVRGNLSIYNPSSGFLFEPGLCLFYSTDFKVGLDFQWFYFKRFGLFSGFGVNPRTKNGDGYVSLGYTLPFSKFDNTSIYCGYSAKQSIILGCRVKF